MKRPPRLRIGDRVLVPMWRGADRVGTLISQGCDSGGPWAIVCIDGYFSVNSPEGELLDARSLKKAPVE